LLRAEARFRHQPAQGRRLAQTPHAVIGELAEAVQTHARSLSSKFKVQSSKFSSGFAGGFARDHSFFAIWKGKAPQMFEL
jgi:hypothetical protein